MSKGLTLVLYDNKTFFVGGSSYFMQLMAWDICK